MPPAIHRILLMLASLTSPRISIAVAGILLLATPVLLPRRDYVSHLDFVSESSRISLPG